MNRRSFIRSALSAAVPVSLLGVAAKAAPVTKPARIVLRDGGQLHNAELHGVELFIGHGDNIAVTGCSFSAQAPTFAV
jgi:hypothetical protein